MEFAAVRITIAASNLMNEKSSNSANAGSVSEGTSLNFLWARYPTNSNTWQRKPAPEKIRTSNFRSGFYPPSTSGPKPYRRKATSARYTTVLVLGVGIPRPKNWSGDCQKNPEKSTEKPSSRPQKGVKTKAHDKVQANATAKGNNKKTTLVNIDVPVVCPCMCVCICMSMSVCICKLHVPHNLHQGKTLGHHVVISKTPAKELQFLTKQHGRSMAGLAPKALEAHS